MQVEAGPSRLGCWFGLPLYSLEAEVDRVGPGVDGMCMTVVVD